MIVTLKSKCGILQGVIILLMVFVKKEMKVMNNNNAVEEILVTRTLTGIVIFGSKIIVARILVIRFWSQDSGHRDSGYWNRDSGHGDGHRLQQQRSRSTVGVSHCQPLGRSHGILSTRSLHSLVTWSSPSVAFNEFQGRHENYRILATTFGNSLCGDLLMFFMFSMRLESKGLYRTYIVF